MIERQVTVSCYRYLSTLSAEPESFMKLGHPTRGVSGAPSGEHKMPPTNSLAFFELKASKQLPLRHIFDVTKTMQEKY